MPDPTGGETGIPGVLRYERFLDPRRSERLRAVAAGLVADAYRREQPLVVFGGEDAPHDQDPLFLDSGDGAYVFHEPAASRAATWPGYRDGVARIGHGLHAAVPEVQELVADPQLAELCRSLGAASPAVIESMFLLKSALTDQLDVHIDHTYLWTDPPSVVLLWFALEDADEANGCLYVDPRGPVGAARSRLRRVGAGTRMEGSDPMPEFASLAPLPARQGDLLVVDGLVPHASPAGHRAGRSRDALGIHVVDAGARVPDDFFLGRLRVVPLANP